MCGSSPERLVLINRQLAHARSQLDRLVHQLAEAAPAEDPDAPAETAPAPSPLPLDAAILRSLPGIGTGVLATLLAEGNDALRRRGLRRASLSPRGGAGHPAFGQEPARGAPPSCPRPAARRRLTTGLALLPTATRSAAPSIRRWAAAAMDTLARCAQWPTACSTSPAPCSATAPASTRTVQEMSPRELATHALDRHSPRLGESDDQTARGRCVARLCVHGDGTRPCAIPSPHARLDRRHDNANRHLQNGGESFSGCHFHRGRAGSSSTALLWSSPAVLVGE